MSCIRPIRRPKDLPFALGIEIRSAPGRAIRRFVESGIQMHDGAPSSQEGAPWYLGILPMSCHTRSEDWSCIHYRSEHVILRSPPHRICARTRFWRRPKDLYSTFEQQAALRSDAGHRSFGRRQEQVRTTTRCSGAAQDDITRVCTVNPERRFRVRRPASVPLAIRLGRVERMNWWGRATAGAEGAASFPAFGCNQSTLHIQAFGAG